MHNHCVAHIYLHSALQVVPIKELSEEDQINYPWQVLHPSPFSTKVGDEVWVLVNTDVGLWRHAEVIGYSTPSAWLDVRFPGECLLCSLMVSAHSIFFVSLLASALCFIADIA